MSSLTARTGYLLRIFRHDDSVLLLQFVFEQDEHVV
jgi:hypothetical protein